MKLALFADIHSNLEALRACLDHAKALGAERHAFLGDLVGYGADPVAVLELIEAHAARGAIVVLGNHDAAAIGRPVRGMNEQALAAIAWTRERLGRSQSRFLEALPLMVREEDRLFVHASAAAPERWTYVTGRRQAAQCIEATDASVIFCGHVHEQRLYYTGAGGYPPVPLEATMEEHPTAAHRQWLAIVGSAGQPRDRNTAACYALADLARLRITFFRVAYDHGTAAQKIRAAGLPERLARRLERGS